jgi:hypothetical protein
MNTSNLTQLRTPSTSIARELDATESARLAELELVVERGIGTFKAVGDALAEISNHRLYRATHATFKEYVETKWKMAVRTAYEHIQRAELVKSLPEECANFAQIINPSQARELAKIQPERRAEVLEVAAGKGKVTAKSIKSAHTTINVEAAVTRGEPTGEPCPPPARNEHIIGFRRDSGLPDLADVLRDDPKEFKPRLKTKSRFLGWWHRSTPTKRAEFLPWLFGTPVVVTNKADLRKKMESWFEHFVSEAAP